MFYREEDKLNGFSFGFLTCYISCCYGSRFEHTSIISILCGYIRPSGIRL